MIETTEQIRGAQRLGLSPKEIGPILKAYARSGRSRERGIEFLEARP